MGEILEDGGGIEKHEEAVVSTTTRIAGARLC
jgi:hypothetical protein